MRTGLSIVSALFCVITASAVPVERSTGLKERAGRTFIGYNGFNGTPRLHQARGGGGNELGAVFYVADAVDLAKLFAHGANSAMDFVSLIHADTTEWNRGGNAVNAFSPGAVVFASHTHAGLLPQAPASVYQLGIRQAQIGRLQLTSDCRPKAQFANDHHTFNYPSLDRTWNIQRPA